MFVKEEISHMVSEIENTNIDSIWVRIHNKSESKNDIYLGTYYISTDNQKSKNKFCP